MIIKLYNSQGQVVMQWPDDYFPNDEEIRKVVAADNNPEKRELYDPDSGDTYDIELVPITDRTFRLKSMVKKND